MDESTKASFDISEPTEQEVELIIQKVRDQYTVTLSKDDAIKYTKLYEELKQWFLMEKNLNSSESIAEELAEEIQECVKNDQGLEINHDQAQNIIDKSLTITINNEKERITNEIRALIGKYKSKDNL